MAIKRVAHVREVLGMKDHVVRDERLYELPADRWTAELENQEIGDLSGDSPLRESKAWQRVIFDSVPSGIIIVDPERHVIIDINPAATRMFGSERKHIIGSVCHKYICPAEIGQCPITDLGKTVDNAERVLLKANGDACPVIKTVTPILLGGRTYLIESFTDITDRKQAEERVRQSEKRFRDISEAAGEFLLEMDPDGRLTFLSDRAMNVLGYASRELLGRTPFDLMPSSEADHARLLFGEHLHNRTGFRDFEVHIATKSGRMVWVSITAVPIFDVDGTFLGHRGAAMDITERKQTEEQLLRNAFYDGLTDLPNRALFMDRLGHALRRANRTEDYSCTVIFLDLDRFKVVNDSLGHMVGDKLLKETARRLERCVRPGDTVARLGGDEFVMLFEQTHDVETAKAIAERIQHTLSFPFMIEGSEIRCSASIGIALTSREYTRPEEVLRDADITMYRAKALGRARCEVFDPSMRLEAAALLSLENDLRRALEFNELRIHYQPIVTLSSGETTGLEALVRWQHPRRGLVPPGDFIPLAEETGLIVPIGQWVLRTACSQMKTWQEEGLAPLRMAVNISTVQLRQADFVDIVVNVLEETRIDPGLLDLEVTESVFMDRDGPIIETFHKLKALGIRISLDDFGTGYSSLSYLQGLPVDVLKIDGSFTKNLATDKERRKIFETILMLGKSLGTEVIAEGIETDEQLDYLKAIDCGSGQGFLFSRPVDEKAIKALVYPGSQKSLQPLDR
jgi:diguanylate cyclase (GGDEF)-like protein/PAS domain S-box-containing protein